MAQSQNGKLTIRQKIIFGFGLALVTLALVATVAYRSTRGFVTSAHLLAHSREVFDELETLKLKLMEVESGARGYLATKDEACLHQYESAQAEISGHVAKLMELSSDRSVQVARLQKMQPLIVQWLGSLKQAISARRNERTQPTAVLLVYKGEEAQMREIRQLLFDFKSDENQLLTERSDSIDRIGRSTIVVILLVTVLSVLFVTVASYFILRDVGARRRAEDALAEEHNLLGSIMDTLPDQVCVKDVEGRYVMDNNAHRVFVGVKGVDEVDGKTVFDFFPHEIAEMYAADDSTVLKEAKPLSREEPSVDREGRLTWLATTKVPLKDTDGRTIGIVCVSTNNSERKENEEKLRLAAAQLERSNLELQEFASVASHDLQEPLRKIQAFGDRLRRKCGEGLGEDGRDYLERMLDAARRMQILLHDLLTLSRVTSQAQPFVQTDMREVMKQVVSLLEVRIEQAGAVVAIGDMPTLDADPSQMRQLFQNLISNALKFQKPGTKPLVELSARTIEVQDQYLPGATPGEQVCEITVRDNGIGFDEKYAERIFAVFQRLHSRSEFEGTGIGLAVCRKILDRHGGTISARSVEGEGATFIVTLPLKQRMKETDEKTG